MLNSVCNDCNESWSALHISANDTAGDQQGFAVCLGRLSIKGKITER